MADTERLLCSHVSFWRAFHAFFWALAAVLFPKSQVDVRLSAPVFLEVYEDPEKSI